MSDVDVCHVDVFITHGVDPAVAHAERVVVHDLHVIRICHVVRDDASLVLNAVRPRDQQPRRRHPRRAREVVVPAGERSEMYEI